jgi:hypothetical protein
VVDGIKDSCEKERCQLSKRGQRSREELVGIPFGGKDVGRGLDYECGGS